jgi:endonuclease YncB( thermonuclease family)
MAPKSAPSTLPICLAYNTFMTKRLRITKRTPLWMVLLIVLLALAQHYNWIKPAEQKLVRTSPGHYQVLSVADGDTLEVNMNGKTERVRMIGVDTPETHDPRKAVQCYGQAASDFTKNLLSGQTVRLEADPLSTNRDRYDRLLRYVYLPDNRLVQAELIREGFGFAYTSFPFTKSVEFKALEREATEANRGLWNNCEVKGESTIRSTNDIE